MILIITLCFSYFHDFLSQSGESYLDKPDSDSTICRQILHLSDARLVLVQLRVRGFAASASRNGKTTISLHFPTFFETLRRFLTPCSALLIPGTLAVVGICVNLTYNHLCCCHCHCII